MTALIHGVVQTNLRTMLEFSRVEDPQAFADCNADSLANTWRRSSTAS
jgi:hypothetical protein